MSRLMMPTVLALAVVLCATTGMLQAKPPAGDQVAFGVIKGPSFDKAKSQALAWLKDAGADAATLAKAEALWNPADDRALLDRVAETLMLGDAEARELIANARNSTASAPTEVPAILKDTQRPTFFRANLALYVAKQLTNRRVHDEALEALKTIRPEQVVDPASYYFFKAVAENRMVMKEEGLQSIDRLLNSVADVPERYTAVATLMKHEMEGWKDKDLGYAARRMEEIEGRLGIARGGPKTQEKQKEVIALLDQMIKDLEAQCAT